MAPKKRPAKVKVSRRATGATVPCSSVAAKPEDPTIEDSRSQEKAVEDVDEQTAVANESISKTPSSFSPPKKQEPVIDETPDRTQVEHKTPDVDIGSRTKVVQEDPKFEASVERNANNQVVESDGGKKEGGEEKRVVKKRVVRVVKKLVKKKVPKRVEQSAVESSTIQNNEILAGSSKNVELRDTGSGKSERNQDVAKKNNIPGGSSESYQRMETIRMTEVDIGGRKDGDTAEKVEDLGKIEDDARNNKGNVLVNVPKSVPSEVEKNEKSEANVGTEAAQENEMDLNGNNNDSVIKKVGSGCEIVMDEMSIDSALNENIECGNKGMKVSGPAEEQVGSRGGGVNPEGNKDGCGVVFSGELEALERRKRRKTEIYIGGLGKDAREVDIRKVFEEVGQVVEVRLIKNDNKGKSKCFAFVRYASADYARRALEKYKKVEICGKECSIAEVEGNDTLYLGNIDRKWKSEDVIKLLTEIGVDKIDRVNIMPDPKNSNRNRGFAFLELETCKDAQIAYRILQKKEVLGKLQNVKVEWAEPLNEPDEAEMRKVKSVYVEYIPSSWDEGKLKDYFEKFGEIENIVHARSLPSSRRKDFAFVNYTTREAALTCINSLNRKPLSDNGCKVNLKVSLAKPQNKGKPNKKASNPVKQKPSLVVSAALPIEAKSMGISIGNNHEDELRNRRSSTNAELLQLLREQASWGEPPRNLRTGSPTIYSSLSGQKRPFTALQDDSFYSEPRVYGQRQFNTNAVASSRPPSHGSRLTSLPYHQHQSAGYPLGYDYPDYTENRRIEEDPYYGRRGALYPRYW